MRHVFYFILFFSSAGWAETLGLNTEFKSLVARSKLGPLSEQAYCYVQGGGIQGFQKDKLQRIASVTKLLSTLLASETLNLNGHFFTRFYISNNSLHIEGGEDPYFEEEKLLLLFRSLNALGYKKFDKVTFDKKFYFNDTALSSYQDITPAVVRTRMINYFSGAKTPFVRAKWQSVRKFAEEEGFDLEVTAPLVTAKLISFVEKNPLAEMNPIIFQHTSRPLRDILKTMNVQSKNFVAENIYKLASRTRSLSSLFSEAGIPPQTYRIYNGSGLPILGSKRLDNLSSCSSILKSIQLLSVSLKKHQLTLSDVVAVNGGKDLGSFRNRFEDFPETHEAVISKTGTLKNASSLGGVLLMNDEVPFAILNQTTNTSAARKFQDLFVSRMFDLLGTPRPIPYEKISIFPWDGTEFLKPVN
jgi:D-alanyl-D-alanine carboxypeptidase